MAGATYPSLHGRTVLVSGGASGIGAAIVEAFVGQGARVGFLDFDREAGAALAARLGPAALYRFADLRDVESLRAAVREVEAAFGAVTVLVNNAARDDRHVIDEVTPDYWRERMATNIDHHFFAAQAVKPGMVAAGGGSIVSIGSTSYLVSDDSFAAYKTAKSATVGLVRALARELGGHGIRVNCLLPGWIMTARQREKWVKPDSLKTILERQCVKRELVAEDIAKAVLFLASDEAGAVTAQTLIVDGGWY